MSLKDRVDGFSLVKFGDPLTMSYARNMKIFFARHGRTNYNDLDLCNSDPNVDVHITPEGEKQAQALANKLRKVHIEQIFVSELKRTTQTADIVNQFHHVPITVEPLLSDHRSGYEGRPASQLIEAMDAAKNRWTARFNGGESIEDVKQRVATFLESLQKKPYDSVLVITSGWVIKMAAAVIQNVPNDEAWKTDAKQGDYLKFDT